MEFMPGPRLNENEDYFTYGPPNFNQNTEPPIDYSARRNLDVSKFTGDKPADYFNEALSEGEMVKRKPGGEQFLNPYNPVPADAPANIQNLMNGLQGKAMRFNSSNVTNGVGFNNDSDYFEVGPGYVSAGGTDLAFRGATDGISAQYRPGQTGISGDVSFNPGFNGAPETVSGGVRYTSPDRRFNAGISGTAAEGQNPTLRGNIGYNTEKGGFTAQGGIDAQGMPEGRINFNVGETQLLPDQIEQMKAGVGDQVDNALGLNQNNGMRMPEMPNVVDNRSAGQKFKDQYLTNKYGAFDNYPIR